MDADRAETSAAGARRNGYRLTNEGRKLLKDFAEKVTMYPDSRQRQQLLDDLRRFPGCDHAQPGTVQHWFQRHRISARKKATPDDDSLLFPNFARHQLEVLRTLLRNNPSPAKDMIGIWATCIQAELEEVKMWVSYQQAKVISQEASEDSMSASPTSPHPHLPTPAMSLSPGVREMSLPAIATKQESSPPGTPLLNGWPTHVPPPTSSSQNAIMCVDELDERHSQIPSPERSRPLCDVSHTVPSPVVQLAQEMKHVREATRPAPRLPTTHAEFDVMFKPYEEMMKRFIHNIDKGKLRHLGWASTT